MPDAASTARDVSGAAVDVGKVFQSGGADGLILYASVLSAFFLFLILGLTLWLTHRERTRAASDLLSQSTQFANAADKTAEAMKEAATAIASAASADMTFKQTLTPMIERLDDRLSRLEHPTGSSS